MWLRTLVGFIAGLLLGLFATLLHRGAAVPLDPPAAAERLPLVVLDELSFKDVPFNKAIDAIAEKSGVSIAVNWPVLKAAGIEANTPIYFSWRNVSLRVVLNTLLAKTGGSTQLSYVMANGVVTISTADQLEQIAVVRVYDVKELIDAAAASGFPAQKIASIGQTGSVLIGGGGTLEPGDALVSLIEDIIAPDTWRDNGGSLASAKIWGGRDLVIVTTPKIQDRVAHFLVHLRNPLPPSALRALPAPKPAVGLLDRELDDVNLQDVSFKEAIDRLQTLSGTIIKVDWLALADAGVKYDTRINIHLRHRTLGETLSSIASSLGNPNGMGAWEDGETVCVSITEPSPNGINICVYDVHDLLGRPRTADATTNPTAADALIQTIEGTVGAETWQDAFGNMGSCRVFEGELVVNTTPKIQAAVADFLIKLRNPIRNQAK